MGCESIAADALTQFKNEAPENCEVVFEPLAPLRADRPLLDPVALVFNSKRSDGQDCLIVLVQFKTFHSRDNTFAEEAVLKRGTTVYRLGGGACQAGCRVSYAAKGWVALLLKCSSMTESRSGLSVTTSM